MKNYEACFELEKKNVEWRKIKKKRKHI